MPLAQPDQALDARDAALNSVSMTSTNRSPRIHHGTKLHNRKVHDKPIRFDTGNSMDYDGTSILTFGGGSNWVEPNVLAG